MEHRETQPLEASVPQNLEAYKEMSVEDKAKVNQIMDEVNIMDSAAVLQYGNQAQSDVATFADRILNQIRAKDSGYVGDVLTELMDQVQDMEVESLGESGLFGLFGSMKRKSQKFMAKYDKISGQLDRTVGALDKSRMQLLKDITTLDELYDRNLAYHRELDYYIIAGEKKIHELRDVALPELKAKAEATNDPSDAQRYNDSSQLLNRFEKKVHDLKLSQTIALQTGPQVRLIQNNDQLMVEKIQSSIFNTIPLWKNQIVIAMSLLRQDKALKQQQVVNKTTNDLLKKNSEMLKQNSVEVARESEKGIVEIETLKKVNQDLIDTIEETLQIQRDGSAKRAQAEQEISQMEAQLKDTLTAVRE